MRAKGILIVSKVVLITGTRKGIGKSVAEYYLDKSFVVAGCSRKDQSISDRNYIHYEADVSNEDQVVEMVRDLAEKQGRIDYLINNAGIASMNHILLTPYSVARDIINTNLIGPFLMMREVSKVMMKKRFGRIVNFSTVAVPLRLQGEALYAASKAGVEELTRIAAKELGTFGITVNAIGPSPVRTDLIKNVPAEKIASLLDSQAIKRMGEFDDVTNVLDFLLNDKSGFVTGQVIYLGGVG